MRVLAWMVFAGVTLGSLAVMGQVRSTLPGERPLADPAVMIVTDAQAAGSQAGPYEGGGRTTVYRYFDNGESTAVAFRKRILHPGSAIGPHPVAFDEEVYYVLSGRGTFVVNGKSTVVSAGTSILMRRGATVSLTPIGDDDLVMFIAYPRT